MLANLVKLFSVPKELTDNEKFEIIERGINTKIQIENNLFNIISLYGINNIIKIIKFWPGVAYDSFINNLYKSFENYYMGKKEENKYIKNIISIVEKNTKLSEIINQLIIKEEERELLYLFCLVNIDNKLLFLFVLLFLLNKKINIILEYEDSSFSSFIRMEKMIELFRENVFKKIISNINENKLLNIQIIKDNFIFMLYKNSSNDIKDLKEFEIMTIVKKGDNKIKKIFNLKSFDNNIMEPFYITRLRNIELELKAELSDNKEKIQSLVEENEKLKNNINSLNKKVEDLETAHSNLKGRFIFKAFSDYILLLFGININLKFETKINLLKEKLKNKGIHFMDAFFIIEKMKNLYNTETNISHKESSVEEIRTTILNQFYDYNYEFMCKFFDKINPEKDVQTIIRKNNELTKLMISDNNGNNKEKEDKIISEINNILTAEKKEESITIFKNIIKEYYE